jgi:hypothetical protein
MVELDPARIAALAEEPPCVLEAGDGSAVRSAARALLNVLAVVHRGGEGWSPERAEEGT